MRDWIGFIGLLTLPAVDGCTEVLLGALQFPRVQIGDAQLIVSVGVQRIERERAPKQHYQGHVAPL